MDEPEWRRFVCEKFAGIERQIGLAASESGINLTEVVQHLTGVKGAVQRNKQVTGWGAALFAIVEVLRILAEFMSSTGPHG
jgi:hypothetical protein